MWLLEWLESTWQEIVAGVSLTTLVSVVVMIVKNIASGKVTSKLTNNLSNLTSDLSSIAGTKDTINENTKSNTTLIERVNTLEIALNANNKALEAMLSIMGVVYMRSKDEDVRNSVASIIGTFKNGDITIRNLKLEIDKLKEELAKTKEQETLNETEEQHTETNEDVEENEVPTEVLMRG